MTIADDMTRCFFESLEDLTGFYCTKLKKWLRYNSPKAREFCDPDKCEHYSCDMPMDEENVEEVGT